VYSTRRLLSLQKKGNPQMSASTKRLRNCAVEDGLRVTTAACTTVLQYTFWDGNCLCKDAL
jgi:hypothetical protein